MAGNRNRGRDSIYQIKVTLPGPSRRPLTGSAFPAGADRID